MNKRYYSYNRIHPLAHQYSLGDWLSKQVSGKFADELWGMTKSGIGDALKGSAANIAVGVGSKIINPNGNKTAFSDFGNTVSNLVSMIPGVGPVVGLGLNFINKFADAAFGSNVNDAAVRGLDSDISSARSNVGNSLTWDTLANNIQDLGGIDVEGADLGSQGWFSHAVDNERDRLRKQKEQAQGILGYAVDNINTLENRQAMGTLLANGGGIHIKPSKKGTFTAQATKMGMGVQEAARHILANKENYSPAMVKKANFARNAAKWHAEGGPIFKTDYDMGLTFVNAGGTHEQNPYGGVFMGMAPDGQPNQVEEGEVIFNDYVYSNRLKVPKAVRNKYKMREKKDLSFADAIEEYIKKNGIEERNNDPIANRGLEAFASELAMEQEMVKAKKEMKENRQAAFGGPLDTIRRYGLLEDKFNSPNLTFSEGGHLFADGDYILYDRNYRDFKNLYNPDSPYMQAINWFDSEEHTAEREALINDIINGKYGAVPANRAEDIRTNWRSLAQDSKKGPVHNALIAWANQTHADAEVNRAKEALPKVSPNISGISIDSSPLGTTTGVHTIGPQGTEDRLMYAQYNNALAGQTPKERVATKAAEHEKENTYDPTYWWRMAGLGANAAGLMSNILDPYHPQVVNEARYTTINPKYLGDYTQYTPYDINYATSQQDANTAAIRNALMQSTAPIRNASLLANDFNANATRGATRRQALEYNDALRKAVADFNRGTNQFNAQMYVDAATKNQAAKQAYFQDRLRQAQFNSQLDFQHKMMRDQAIGQGLTAIGDYLNDMGREDINAGMVDAVIKSGVPLNSPMDTMYSGFLNRRAAREQRRAARRSRNSKG